MQMKNDWHSPLGEETTYPVLRYMISNHAHVAIFTGPNSFVFVYHSDKKMIGKPIYAVDESKWRDHTGCITLSN